MMHTMLVMNKWTQSYLCYYHQQTIFSGLTVQKFYQYVFTSASILKKYINFSGLTSVFVILGVIFPAWIIKVHAALHQFTIYVTIRCLVLCTSHSQPKCEKEFFDKLFLAAQSCSFRKNGTVDVLYPNNDFLYVFWYWD